MNDVALFWVGALLLFSGLASTIWHGHTDDTFDPRTARFLWRCLGVVQTVAGALVWGAAL